MSGLASRSKGARGEREVTAILRRHGLTADRTVTQTGLYVRGDLTGVDGYHFEVKRQETLRLPLWLAQAADECGDAVPVVAFRQNRGEWYAALPLNDLARLLALANVEPGLTSCGRDVCPPTNDCRVCR